MMKINPIGNIMAAGDKKREEPGVRDQGKGIRENETPLVILGPGGDFTRHYTPQLEKKNMAEEKVDDILTEIKR